MRIRIHGCPVGIALAVRYLVTLTAMALVVQSSAVGATLICRWVDENGQQHMSDWVPEKFKTVATCTNYRQYENSSDQQKEVEPNAPSEGAKSSSAEAGSAKESEVGAGQPPAAGPSPNVKLPIEVVTDTTDCQTWWRIYDESAVCFGPYRTTRGGVRAEAFDKCNDIPSPELKCGPRRN